MINYNIVFSEREEQSCMLQFVRARKAVISNASMWDTSNLLPKEVLPKSYLDRINTTPQCESFMHLHLGFDAGVSKIANNKNLILYVILLPDFLGTYTIPLNRCKIFCE